ncbi:heme ABC transporter ATP-binding protein [Marinagarivorans algicola]|uniref:heme ABC transporter ATP-binding protein n=1 Tax=Marinagarivorans algicola TaxID=1513270 RepID=UPI0006B9552E|nr:heme ABC transporter ATP-binding protein [Marinagarivorans algicola]
MLELKNISVKQGEAFIVSDVSLTLKAGEILSIIGPNGAGKSTLISAILGDASLAAGQIHFARSPIQRWPLQARACHMACLPQTSALSFPFTVEEVVMLGRVPHSSGAKADGIIVEQAMALMDIGYLYGRPYTALSGGEKQRTQLARVMAQIWRTDDADPRLLILDEPTSSLDLGHKQQLMAAVKYFAEQGVAVLMIEHDLAMVANYAHQLLALQCGHTVAYGAVESHLSAALIKKLFDADTQVIRHGGVLNVVNCKL